MEDVEAVFQIECASFSMPWSIESLQQEVSSLFAVYNVVTIDERIVAYGGMRIILDEGEITNIAVDSSYRGRGIGRKLFESLLVQAKQKDVRRITLEVRSSNEAAKRLYLVFGFRPVAIRKGYYQKPTEDAVIMQLQLDF
ncbi:MAG: ribosomal-protein-alanine acetyltransferase [Clostridia bacterium]|nr:ribosomal-protein-alanine acetyltransferase [Clostridia bacterium]